MHSWLPVIKMLLLLNVLQSIFDNMEDTIHDIQMVQHVQSENYDYVQNK
jgi:hypothetical protein